MKLLVIDNYDSFTYNLVHYLEMCTDGPIEVFRNDGISIGDIGKFDKILLSPGPGVPSAAGIMPELLERYKSSKSILGICLGQQAIAEAFGGKIMNMEEVYHGVAMPIRILSHDKIFRGIPSMIKVGRYHSWTVDRQNLPAGLEITAEDEHGNIMALKHRTLDVQGVQFHPESILTEHGLKMIKNWISD